MKINLFEQNTIKITISNNSVFIDAYNFIQENPERSCFLVSKKK